MSENQEILRERLDCLVDDCRRINLAKSKLCGYAGVSFTTLWKWESFPNRKITKEILDKLEFKLNELKSLRGINDKKSNKKED